MAIQQADIASGLADISKLSNDELKELCNSTSNEKYDEIVSQNDKVSLVHIFLSLLSSIRFNKIYKQ